MLKKKYCIVYKHTRNMFIYNNFNNYRQLKSFYGVNESIVVNKIRSGQHYGSDLNFTTMKCKQ